MQNKKSSERKHVPPANLCEAAQTVAKGSKMAAEKTTDIENIKRLLILLLRKLAATSEEIGAALDVDSSGSRKLSPIRSVKRLEFIR